MECLRVKLYTPTGIFKNPLSIKGIEIYPLPPYSTIIGLIYRAMGRKWNGEYFQISIQGDYQAIYRDYVWFKKHNFKDKELSRLPLQVPILYNLWLLIHIKASEELLNEIENGLKEPKELLFLSGGEYPVKVEEVKRVKCFEKRLSEEETITLNYNAYIPKEFKEKISLSGTGEGVLFSLSYFYKNSQKPKTYSWIDAYYLQKGTEICGSLILDEDNNPVFLAEPTTKEIKKSEGEEYVRFYAGNWLMASACVGVLKVLENAGEDIKKYVEERTLKIPKSLWENLPELYADYLLKDKESVKRSLEDSYRQKAADSNPYNTLIYSRLRDFHSNSPFTNQSHEYIKRLKGVYSENLEEVLGKVKESFLEAYKKLLATTKDLSSICFFCHERHAKNYVDATTFTPLFASLETVRNFIWDPIPICKECEFLLYFASAGFYRYVGKYLFVYVPDDLLETYRLNLILSTEKEIEQEKLSKVWSVVRYVLDLEKQKSSWVLQNIYFVEIEMVGDATANIYSFHISPNLAKAIRKLIDHYPKNLQDIFSEFLFYIYTGRSLYEFLFLMLSGFIRKESYKKLQGGTIESKILQAGRNMKYISQNLLFFINFQEVLNMNEQKGYIDRAFWAGRELKKLYKENESTQKKLEPLTYRLLEAIRRKDKEYFIHNLIRAYLEVEKEIPYLFKEALDDKNFSMIAYAFLIGLNSEEKNKEEQANDYGENSESA
ncbi:CRISPR-associated protein Cas5 [Thermocrinis ruber]|uniref:CRISPR-associated protein Cas5 n=1 Tax=Thermocrinis ruber TaxID=75906 RepID=W0DFK9_9AQUI|nr:type I-B CRISPR-associated protein Cas5b [Thermocrinis ruber]AHE96042.1 CRISPR-associated protein Cas5 [Thermocrinis ruber]